jgi:acetyltransferase-like isoleucine patch superfamily enzyme
VNSERAVVVAWFAENGQWVNANVRLVTVETSKAVLEIETPDEGYLMHLANVNDEIALTEPIAILFDTVDALKAHEAQLTADRAAAGGLGTATRASLKAIKRAEELGIDLSTLSTGNLITVKDVEAAAKARQTVDFSRLPQPLTADATVERVVLIGGGLGATQVLDILAGSSEKKAVAVVDDKPDTWGGDVAGIPVVGPPDRLKTLYEERTFDAAIVAISTSVVARKKFRDMCQEAGIPLTNAIDKTSKVATGVTMGTGNVICAFCHIGTWTRIGDNNFISAYNSFDHHNVLGSDISTGPACFTSSRVTLGDQVRLGTGIHIEPGVELGDRVQVASGATIVMSVPADHVVKTKSVTTTVVPLRT